MKRFFALWIMLSATAIFIAGCGGADNEPPEVTINQLDSSVVHGHVAI